MLSSFKDTITKELLLYAAGRTMFCPACGQVMDWKRVVIIEQKDKSTNVVCTNCFDCSEVIEKFPDAEITDARTCWEICNPLLLKQTGEKTSVDIVNGKLKKKNVNGEVLNHPDFGDFVLHNDPETGKLWAITEPTTGTKLCQHSNKDYAIKLASCLLSFYGIKGFQLSLKRMKRHIKNLQKRITI